MYYHYTSTSGAKAIRSSSYINPSDQSGAFGPGVYLTDLDPCQFFRDEILTNNYGGIRILFLNRADWVVKITEDDIDIQLLRQVHVPGEYDRRIFVYPHRIFVPSSQIYDKPECLRRYESDTSEEGEGVDECPGSYESDEDEYDGIEIGVYESGEKSNVSNEDEGDGSEYESEGTDGESERESESEGGESECGNNDSNTDLSDCSPSERDDEYDSDET